jgi:hypothetical protein
MLKGLNWGDIIAWSGIALSIGAAIGYAFAKDIRHALYFTFGAAITITVIWR